MSIKEEPAFTLEDAQLAAEQQRNAPKKKQPKNEIANIPVPTLMEMVNSGDRTSLQTIKEKATGPLSVYIIRMIEAGRVNDAKVAIQFLDVIYKHTPKETAVVQTELAFFKELK